MTDDTPMRARASTRDAVTPIVVDLAALPGERRTPHVMAYVRIGPVVVAYAVAGLKRGKTEVRPPYSVAGEHGVVLPDAMEEAVDRAIMEAVQARPDLRRFLLRR